MQTAKKDRIFKANQSQGRLREAVKFRSNRYEVTRGIWKNVAVPIIIYGIYVVPCNKNVLNQI